jgi:hypothetical protein
MSRREPVPGKHPANTVAGATRRKFDQIVRSVIDSDYERDFDAIAVREIKDLQRAAARRTPLTVI